MRKCIEELNFLIKAKQECVWVNTHEEINVINDIIELHLREQSNEIRNIYTWSIFEGLKKVVFTSNGIEKGELVPGTQNVMKLLQHIEGSQDSSEGSENIYILKDLHLCMDNQGVLIRALRDLKESKPAFYNPVIITSPVVNIPTEWEKMFDVIDYDLPDKEDIRIIINKSLEQLEEREGFIPLTEEQERDLINSCIGLTQKEIVSAFRKSTVKHDTISVSEVMNQKIQLVKKSGILDYSTPDCSIDDIGGNHELKKWLVEIEDSMSDEAVEFGCAKPKGFMSIGIPGCSKTMFANAIANDWNVPLLQLSMSKIMSKLVGESERKMAQALKIAESCSPCVLLIDEVEKALGGIQSSNQSDSGTTARTFEQLLQFLQKENDVFVIMTSNDIQQLPPELYRSERLETVWYFSLPTPEEREEIYAIHLNKTGKDMDKGLIEFCAKNTENFTGAEIAQSVKNAVRKAYTRYKEDGVNALTTEDMKVAISEVTPVYKVNREKIIQLESWAEGRARYTNETVRNKDIVENNDSKLLQMLERELIV